MNHLQLIWLMDLEMRWWVKGKEGTWTLEEPATKWNCQHWATTSETDSSWINKNTEERNNNDGRGKHMDGGQLASASLVLMAQTHVSSTKLKVWSWIICSRGANLSINLLLHVNTCSDCDAGHHCRQTCTLNINNTLLGCWMMSPHTRNNDI